MVASMGGLKLLCYLPPLSPTSFELRILFYVNSNSDWVQIVSAQDAELSIETHGSIHRGSANVNNIDLMIG